MTLALLLTAVTGAWATDPNTVIWNNQTWKGWTDMETTHTVGDITITCSGNAKAYENKIASGEPLAMVAGTTDAITFTSNGAPFTSVAIMTQNELNVAGWTYNSSTWSYEWSGTPSTSVTLNDCNIEADMITFTFAAAEAPIEVAWNASTKTGTFTQPGGDVVLTPLYAPTASWAEVETVKQLPAAAEGVIAGTDAPLIVEGIVAFAGTSTEVTQGTVMYAVTPATVTDASELIPSDWKNTVPTAKTVADDGAEVKVWYYIQGADTPDGQQATADNTFNNSEVSSLTVSVRSNKFDLTLKAANANTIEAGKATVTVAGNAATVTDGKIKGVKMGSEVKLNAKQGYKFRKVEVKKGSAAAAALAPALENGATVVIICDWGDATTTFTYTNNGGTFSSQVSGYEADYFHHGLELNSKNLSFGARNVDNSEYLSVGITFNTESSAYSYTGKGEDFSSFTISVNGTDVTDQLSELK